MAQYGTRTNGRRMLRTMFLSLYIIRGTKFCSWNCAQPEQLRGKSSNGARHPASCLAQLASGHQPMAWSASVLLVLQ
ncbi:hypothetical protein J6590_072306 [Homalodisca vitripennis]|nr:hypothetical protein J6590_072306 [Homalodisca vitripennis]